MYSLTAPGSTLTDVQRAYIADPDLLMRARSTMGGKATGDLTARFHADDDRCVVCGQSTMLDSGKAEDSAALMVLIPAGMLDERDGDRYGYVPGNLALSCYACVEARNTYRATTGDPVIMSADCLSLPENVWLNWPRGLGSKRTTRTGTHTKTARSARVRLGLPF